MKRIKRLEGWQGLWKGRGLVADQFCSTKNNASRNVSHPDVLYSPFCAFNRFRWGIRNQRTEKRVQRTRSWRRFVRMSRARSFYSFLSISSFALTRGTEWQFLRSSLP